MIAELLNRDFVLQQLSEVREDLERSVATETADGAATDSPDAALLAELRDAEAREQIASSGATGFEAPEADRRGQEPAPLDDFAFLSRDPIVSLVQSALDEYFVRDDHAHELTVAPPEDDDRRGGNEIMVADTRLGQVPQRTADGRRVFDKFSITDLRWVRSKIAEGVTLLRKKHAFNENPSPPSTIPDRVRLLLVGDWGSGLPRALKVSREMSKILNQGRDDRVPQHVIHLGDVYYSGWEHEVLRRFLTPWPVLPDEAETIGSWSINGNHEMFSGGHAYFDVLLADARFHRQAKSSFFSLVNRHWKILGLDTAWDGDYSLPDPQTTWLRDEIADGSRKVVLLSHHQLFSTYDKMNVGFFDRVGGALARRPARAWFWGHEHRCVVYHPTDSVQAARCIGHGGVPVYMWREAADPYPANVEYEYRGWYPKGFERWALFGFVALDFDGPTVTVRYINEDGIEHREETLS